MRRAEHLRNGYVKVVRPKTKHLRHLASFQVNCRWCGAMMGGACETLDTGWAYGFQADMSVLDGEVYTVTHVTSRRDEVGVEHVEIFLGRS